MRSRILCLMSAVLVSQGSSQFAAVTDDLVVSSQTNRYVYRPSVAASPNGQFAVSWGDERSTSDGRLAGSGSIYGSLFQSNGSAVASNFRVDGLAFGFFSDFSLYHSSAKFLPSGALIVAYHVDARSTIESIKFDDIYYAAFTSAGVRTLVNVQVNKVGGSGSGYGYQPSVSTHGANFIVAYRYYVGSAYNIGLSVVDGNSGALMGDAVPISDNTANNRVYPFAASNGTHIAAVWTDGRTDVSTGDVYLQRFVNGAASGGNVKVNTDAAGGYNQYARVAMNAAGDFAVVWIDTRSHAGGDLYARIYNSSGVAQASEFKLTASNSVLQAYPPGLVMDASGDIVVTWADSVAGQRYTAKTRAFSSAGAALTPITEVTTSFATAPSIQPDVALGPGGVLVFAWVDGRLDANFGRVFAKTATILGVTPVAETSSAIPLETGIVGTFPNPFNPSTQIGWRMKEGGWVKISVLDLLGREVAVLIDAERSAGQHVTSWDASGRPSGTYIVRLVSSGRTDHRRISLVR
jgi:hypothetical protein